MSAELASAPALAPEPETAVSLGAAVGGGLIPDIPGYTWYIHSLSAINLHPFWAPEEMVSSGNFGWSCFLKLSLWDSGADHDLCSNFCVPHAWLCTQRLSPYPSPFFADTWGWVQKDPGQLIFEELPWKTRWLILPLIVVITHNQSKRKNWHSDFFGGQTSHCLNTPKLNYAWQSVQFRWHKKSRPCGINVESVERGTAHFSQGLCNIAKNSNVTLW